MYGDAKAKLSPRCKQRHVSHDNFSCVTTYLCYNENKDTLIYFTFSAKSDYNHVIWNVNSFIVN